MDICRLIVVVIVVVSPHFVCFQFVIIFWSPLSRQSIPLNACVCWAQIDFVRVKKNEISAFFFPKLMKKNAGHCPTVDNADAMSAPNACVRAKCSFIWCDAIRAHFVYARIVQSRFGNVNECDANEWNTPTGDRGDGLNEFRNASICSSSSLERQYNFTVRVGVRVNEMCTKCFESKVIMSISVQINEKNARGVLRLDSVRVRVCIGEWMWSLRWHHEAYRFDYYFVIKLRLLQRHHCRQLNCSSSFESTKGSNAHEKKKAEIVVREIPTVESGTHHLSSHRQKPNQLFKLNRTCDNWCESHFVCL